MVSKLRIIWKQTVASVSDGDSGRAQDVGFVNQSWSGLDYSNHRCALVVSLSEIASVSVATSVPSTAAAAAAMVRLPCAVLSWLYIIYYI